MQARLLQWEGTSFLFAAAEGPSFDAVAAQLTRSLDAHGASLEQAVFHRFWTADRATRDAIKGEREDFFSGARRTASSSFISRERVPAPHRACIELLALAGETPAPRRLVDFTPKRNYARYLAQGGWQFLSGMAETAADMDGQFDRALAEVEAALAAEKLGWAEVRSASLFLERGCAELGWLRDRFARAIATQPVRISFELVDGLASTDKNLEIEVIASR